MRAEMVENIETFSSLDNAKARLQEALTRLEDVVEKRVEDVEALSEGGNGVALNVIQEKLNVTGKENDHLREENQALQLLVGKETDRNRALSRANTVALKKVEQLIGQVEDVINEDV